MKTRCVRVLYCVFLGRYLRLVSSFGRLSRIREVEAANLLTSFGLPNSIFPDGGNGFFSLELSSTWHDNFCCPNGSSIFCR